MSSGCISQWGFTSWSSVWNHEPLDLPNGIPCGYHKHSNRAGIPESISLGPWSSCHTGGKVGKTIPFHHYHFETNYSQWCIKVVLLILSVKSKLYCLLYKYFDDRQLVWYTVYVANYVIFSCILSSRVSLSLSYEWMIPVRWMKSSELQNIWWLMGKEGTQLYASYRKCGCKLRLLVWFHIRYTFKVILLTFFQQWLTWRW